MNIGKYNSRKLATTGAAIIPTIITMLNVSSDLAKVALAMIIGTVACFYIHIQGKIDASDV